MGVHTLMDVTPKRLHYAGGDGELGVSYIFDCDTLVSALLILDTDIPPERLREHFFGSYGRVPLSKHQYVNPDGRTVGAVIADGPYTLMLWTSLAYSMRGNSTP